MTSSMLNDLEKGKRLGQRYPGTARRQTSARPAGIIALPPALIEQVVCPTKLLQGESGKPEGRKRFFLRSLSFLPAFLIQLLFLCVNAQGAEPVKIDWQPWSESIFEKAQKEHRFVLLDLGAVWCHWCHVMDEITYQDPEVIALINARYLAVRVDQDARPDLSLRYENYGWPATVVFNTDGSEIVKRQGYLPPKPMASMLQAIIDDPSPGPSIVAEPALEAGSSSAVSPAQREKLRKILRDNYDPKNKGWGSVQKFLDWDIIEYCMGEAMRGDRAWERMARETLQAQRQLIDPVWGGVDQYSTDGDWKHPHFEKIMQMQAENLRIYAEAYALWKDAADLASAKKIHGYLRDFLTSPEGAFYTSQDADLKPGEHSADYFALDDAGRRKRGIPPIDQHIYARENGWAINALATFYGVTGDASALAEAERAAEWIIANRSLPGGGFRHDAEDAGGPYLGDSIYMARAFLELHAVTSDRKWLERAEAAVQFAEKNFKSEIGYIPYVQALAGKLAPKPHVDENVAVARVTTLLNHYTGNAAYRDMAEHAMRFLALPAVNENHGFGVAGFLLASESLSTPPLHLTVVGKKDDPAARTLFAAALKEPANDKRVEWWERADGPLPNPDVPYPELEKAAAFICTDRSCSAPIFDPAQISAFVRRKK